MKSCLCWAFALFIATAAYAAPPGAVDAMRGNTPLADESRPPPLMDAQNNDMRRGRAYSMQPPTIPAPASFSPARPPRIGWIAR